MTACGIMGCKRGQKGDGNGPAAVFRGVGTAAGPFCVGGGGAAGRETGRNKGGEGRGEEDRIYRIYRKVG